MIINCFVTFVLTCLEVDSLHTSTELTLRCFIIRQVTRDKRWGGGGLGMGVEDEMHWVRGKWLTI